MHLHKYIDEAGLFYRACYIVLLVFYVELNPIVYRPAGDIVAFWGDTRVTYCRLARFYLCDQDISVL
jgi:hypothetical protein